MGYYCGIDLGDKRTEICILNNKRLVVATVSVATEKECIQAELTKYRGLTCIVEASPLAEWLCGVIEELRHKITIVCPRKAKAVLSAHKGKKTDKRDARALAELCRSNWYEAVHRKTGKARELRSFMTARKQLVESSTAIACGIRGLLKSHGIKLPGSTVSKDFAERVKNAASELPDMARIGIEELLSAYVRLHEQQRKMYRELCRRTRVDEATKRLMTIPAVGPVVAAAFVATIDDPKRFESADRVSAYLGLVPSVHQSGDTEYRGRITKGGDKLLRWLLIESAHILLTRTQTTCELKTWGLKLQESKGLGKARVAVARRLAGIMWRMWRDEQTFHPEPMAA